MLAGSTTAPPPVLTTASAGGRVAMTSRSMFRKRSSPSSWKMSGMERPVASSMRESVSKNCTVFCWARIFPISVFPVPRNPVSTNPSHGMTPLRLSQNPGNDLFTHSAFVMVIPPIPSPSTAKHIAVRWSFAGSMVPP